MVDKSTQACRLLLENIISVVRPFAFASLDVANRVQTDWSITSKIRLNPLPSPALNLPAQTLSDLPNPLLRSST